MLIRATLDRPGDEIGRLRTTFSPREEARARKFAPHLRDRWVASRGLLRLILARTTSADPASLRFVYGSHGKPALDPRTLPPGQAPLSFNVSHSGNLALYALARDREVGVDIEEEKPRRTDAVAERFFHPRESAHLRALPVEGRRPAFFATWCCKEAFIKATGAGLSQSMSSFAFAMGPEGPCGVEWQDGDPHAARRWSVHLVSPAPGYFGALVAEARGGQPLALRAFAWPAAAATL